MKRKSGGEAEEGAINKYEGDDRSPKVNMEEVAIISSVCKKQTATNKWF